MSGKLMLVAGLAAGYVLGSRAGRERYDQISKAASKFWQSKPVQQRVHDVQDFAKDKAPDVAGFVSSTAKKVTGKSDKQGTGTTSTANTSPASSDPSI